MTGDTEAPSPASASGQSVSLFLQGDPYRVSSERHLVQPLWGQQGLGEGPSCLRLGQACRPQGPAAISA